MRSPERSRSRPSHTARTSPVRESQFPARPARGSTHAIPGRLRNSRWMAHVRVLHVGDPCARAEHRLGGALGDLVHGLVEQPTAASDSFGDWTRAVTARHHHRPAAASDALVECAEELADLAVQAKLGVPHLPGFVAPPMTDVVVRRQADHQQVGRRVGAETLAGDPSARSRQPCPRLASPSHRCLARATIARSARRRPPPPMGGPHDAASESATSTTRVSRHPRCRRRRRDRCRGALPPPRRSRPSRAPRACRRRQTANPLPQVG